jgi:hypothetical protein
MSLADCFPAPISQVLAVILLIAAPSAMADDRVSGNPQTVDFNRDIRPILSNHCFQCHGADADAREADLRLDLRDSAVEHKAINPEDLLGSLLLSRITSSDPSERMPPAHANKPLNERQIQFLQQWVAEGAKYEDHWAFRSIKRPEVPLTIEDSWCHNAIDAFILQRLQQSKLHPSEEAERAVLIRRMTQDLLGLLPTIEEADAFINDPSPNACENLADRLLSSPHYGERWGRHWLDQARYADSNGYTIDGPRVMWPYRDWVIEAFNQDMPFDQFTIEQIAGDLLPNATKSQRVASAFHRNTMINEEGGVKPDQFRHEAMIDRVNTTGAVWLGLTVGCAQCHSHKFDPITHDEYYQLYAFFNRASDTNNAGETIEVREGEMFGWSEGQREQLKELQDLQKEKAELEKRSPTQTSLAELPWSWQPAKIQGVTASGSVILKIEDDQSILAKSHAAAGDAYTIKLQRPESLDATAPITAIRLRTLTHASLPASGPGTAGNGNFVLTDIALKVNSTEARFTQAWADHSQPDFPVDNAIDDKSNTGWAINVSGQQVAMGVKMNAPHEAIFTLAKPVDPSDAVLAIVMRHDLNKNYLVGHFAIDLSTAKVLMESPESQSAMRLAEIRSRMTELELLLPGKGSAVRQMVMKDEEQPPETFVLTRGDFLHPDRDHGALSPGVPASIKLPDSRLTFANRLDLARWLVSRENPLTARVTVNRVWAKYFGRGLVETENDFGYQSTPPTHPELLDWLAAEFQEHDWSMKHLHRLIVTSAAYRQSSGASSGDLTSANSQRAIEIDPDNYLLGRQTRFRVEAEIVRDMAVVASGLFSPKVGGPGIYLPQPDGIYDFTQNKKDWPTTIGPDRYRRTMYTMFYRSAPYPLLSTFDAPDFSTVCTRRVRSNTPLQSLTVANDLVFTELAEGLARRTLQATDLATDGDRCRMMFRHCLTRHPDSHELDVLLNFEGRELSRFHSAPEEAQKFVTRLETDPPAEILAAWTSVARALLNTDEFLMRN